MVRPLVDDLQMLIHVDEGHGVSFRPGTNGVFSTPGKDLLRQIVTVSMISIRGKVHIT